MEIHPAIVENIRKKETVVFIGSGFSRLAGFPSAQAIASYLSRKLAVDGKRVDFKIADNFDQVAQLFSVTYGRARLIAEMEALLRTSPQDEISPSHRLLASLVKHGFVKTIVTTNYDTLIEDACAQSGAPTRPLEDSRRFCPSRTPGPDRRRPAALEQTRDSSDRYPTPDFVRPQCPAVFRLFAF